MRTEGAVSLQFPFLCHLLSIAEYFIWNLYFCYKADLTFFFDRAQGIMAPHISAPYTPPIFICVIDQNCRLNDSD